MRTSIKSWLPDSARQYIFITMSEDHWRGQRHERVIYERGESSKRGPAPRILVGDLGAINFGAPILEKMGYRIALDVTVNINPSNGRPLENGMNVLLYQGRPDLFVPPVENP